MSVVGVGASRFMKVRADPISRLFNWCNTSWEGNTCGVHDIGVHYKLATTRYDTFICVRRILQEGEEGAPSGTLAAHASQQQR